MCAVTCIATTCSLKASLSANLFGPLECALYGTQRASQWYQDKAHEFLKYFGVKDAENVEIYILDGKLNPANRILPGLTARSGIWFNEPVLTATDEQNKLWFIAHEAAHYANTHVWRKVGIECLFNILAATPATIMCALFAWHLHHYNELKPSSLWKNILKGASCGYLVGIHTINMYSASRSHVYNYAKKLEKEADLAAAQMLCKHGYQATVQARIQTLSALIAKGFVISDFQGHPSLEENLTYLQTFWDEWTKNNPQQNNQ